jgi:hypothetical protein
MSDANPDFAFLSELSLDTHALDSITANLRRVLSGNDRVELAALGKSQDPATILSDWDKVFESEQNLLVPELKELELLNRSKFGPRSLQKSWSERKANTAAYFKSSEGESCRAPIQQIESESGSLRPIGLSNCASFLKNNTNSGLPYMRRKSEVKQRAVAQFSELLQRNDPCVLFTRTQEARKTRDVWGFPIAETLREMRYFRPLFEYQRRKPWRTALLGPTFVDEGITRLLLTARSEGLALVSIDFTAYDSSIGSFLQRMAFDYIKDKFQQEFAPEIEQIAEKFRTIGLVTPEGIWRGEHGVPSGSTFTNEVDSIVQYLAARASGEIRHDDAGMQIQGDDGAYCVADPEKLKEAFRQCGLSVNDEKSYISEEYVVYLQNFYSLRYIRDGVVGGIYPVYRALNRLVYQERYNDKFESYGLSGRDYYSIRTISILENCRHHPLFEKFVEFVARRDKYGLSVSDKGLRNYVRMIDETKGSQDLISNQYGDNPRGLKSFKSYQLIRKL